MVYLGHDRGAARDGCSKGWVQQERGAASEGCSKKGIIVQASKKKINITQIKSNFISQLIYIQHAIHDEVYILGKKMEKKLNNS